MLVVCKMGVLALLGSLPIFFFVPKGAVHILGENCTRSNPDIAKKFGTKKSANAMHANAMHATDVHISTWVGDSCTIPHVVI